MAEQPSAIILGASGCNSLGVARSLGRNGIVCYVFSCGQRGTDQKTSRFVKMVKTPSVDIKTTEMAQFIRSFSEGLPKKPVVFMVNDLALDYVNHYREVFEDKVHLVLGSSEKVSTLLEKAKFHNFVDCCTGVSQPETYFVKSLEDACSAARQIGFPVILKPSVNCDFTRKFAKKCLFVENVEQLIQDWEKVQIEATEYIVQEVIAGGVISGWTGYYDREANLVSCCQYSKVRQFPVDFGVGTFFRTIRNNEIVELGHAILKELEYTGLVDVEFIFDQKTEGWKIVEINPRTCMHNTLSAAAGVNHEYFAYCDLLGYPQPAHLSAEEGYCWTETHKDFASFLSSEDGWGGWLASRRGKKIYAYWCADDPLPFFVRLKDAIDTFGRSLYTKWLHSATSD